MQTWNIYIQLMADRLTYFLTTSTYLCKWCLDCFFSKIHTVVTLKHIVVGTIGYGPVQLKGNTCEHSIYLTITIQVNWQSIFTLHIIVEWTFHIDIHV
jgi:hypothetical protein